jgi:hypothetical protein
LDKANSPIAAWNLYEVCAQQLRHSSARRHGTNCRCLHLRMGVARAC